MSIEFTKSEEKLLSHYAFLYLNEFRYLRDELIEKYKNEGYNLYDSRKLAKKGALKKLIEIDEPIQITDGTWACPICGLHIKDMGSHIKSVHDLSWDKFVEKYNWTEPKIYFSAEYRNNLRNNKLNFYYNTDEGKEWRNNLSERVSGDSNPACRDDVKLKISKARLGKSYLSDKDKSRVSSSTNLGLYSDNAKSYGYIFWAICNGENRRFRSKLEYIIFLMLEYYNIDFEYEPYKIEYFDPSCNYLRHYIVDFVSGSRLFEVKPKESDFENSYKYNLIQSQLNKSNKKLEVLTLNNFYDIFNISESSQKPKSYFECLVLNNIKCGNCKLQIPVMHEPTFYYNSSYLRQLGDNPEQIIKDGALIYENKKNSRNI